MLAMAVLVWQSVATSLVYATDLANPGEESDSTPVVETTVVDEETDESNSGETITNSENSMDSVNYTDEVESEVVVDWNDSLTESEEVVVNTEGNNNDEIDEEITSYGRSFFQSQQEKTWTKLFVERSRWLCYNNLT